MSGKISLKSRINISCNEKQHLGGFQNLLKGTKNNLRIEKNRFDNFQKTTPKKSFNQFGYYHSDR